MKKLLTALTLSCFALTTNAEYMVKIPLEKEQGGRLPNGSILITSDWGDAPTVYGDWLDQGHPYACNNWSPDPSTVPSGETFAQTATDCSQDQSRSVQSQEVERTSGIIRNKGEPYTESRTITVSSTRDSVGTLEDLGTWEEFADKKELSKSWNELQWGSKNLGEIPSAPYPLSQITQIINLSNNGLTHLNGLKNVTSITGWVYLRDNQLTNVDGLIGLTSIGTSPFYINNNRLTNLDGLRNLKTIGGTFGAYNNHLTNLDGLINLTTAAMLLFQNNRLTNVDGLSGLNSVGTLELQNNPLENINGLANVRVNSGVLIDSTYAGPKLPSNSRFCLLNPESVFKGSMCGTYTPYCNLAIKSQLCEAQ